MFKILALLPLLAMGVLARPPACVTKSVSSSSAATSTSTAAEADPTSFEPEIPEGSGNIRPHNMKEGCLTIQGGGSGVDGTEVALNGYFGATSPFVAAQTWEVTANGQIKLRDQDLCLTSEIDQVITCDVDAPAQKWTVQDGKFLSADNKCLTAGNDFVGGTNKPYPPERVLTVEDCEDGASNQLWSY